MRTRILQTSFWDDDVVNGVSKDGILLWVFLLTNKYVGMTNYFKVPDVFILYHTKLTQNELKKAKGELQETGKVFFSGDWIYIPKLEQRNKYKNSPKNSKAYENERGDVPDKVIEEFSLLYKESDSSMDSSMGSSRHSNHKSEIRNQKSETRNQSEGEWGRERLDNGDVMRELQKQYTGVEWQTEFQKMRDWLDSEGKRKKNYLAFARNWIVRNGAVKFEPVGKPVNNWKKISAKDIKNILSNKKKGE